MSEPAGEIIKARVPVAMADALREVADANERTLSAEIRLAIRGYLAEQPEQEAKAA